MGDESYFVVNLKTGKVQKYKGDNRALYTFKQATELLFARAERVANLRLRNEYALVRIIKAGRSYYPSLKDFTLDDEGNLLLEKEIGGLYMVINTIKGVAEKSNGYFDYDLDEAVSLYNSIGKGSGFLDLCGERLLVQVIETWDHGNYV